MPQAEYYEVLIVGSGKAGKTLAADLARAGHRTCLVERGMIGGTCINVGCIPSKALIRCAKVAELTSRAADFGVRTGGRSVDMPAVLAYKRAVVAGMVDVNWNNLHGALGEHFVIGDAHFVAPRTVEVRPADGGPARRITGDKLFINTGARPRVPQVEGLADVRPLTSDTALELDRLPEHLLILGGGYIGVEFGQAFRRFGSRVTLLQRGPHLLPDEDADVSDAIEAILREDGVDVITNAAVRSATGRSGSAVELRVRAGEQERAITGTDLLVATGRVPNTDIIGLELAGVSLRPDGTVLVNDRLETTAPATWAMGDCAGTSQQTHAALDDYRIVKANVFAGGNRRTTDRLIPHTVFIDPELGRVGLTERDARARGTDVRIARVPASVIPRARTLGETRGFLKAVIDAPTGRIVGFAMLGAEAGEVTAAVQMAMLGNLPYTALRDGILAHPTMVEGLNYLFGAPLK